MDFRTAVDILITLLFIAVSVYINLLWLLPEFFNKRRFFLFTLLEIFNVFLFIGLNYFVSMAFEEKHPNFLNEVVAEFILVLVFLVISTLIKFTRDSIALQDADLKIKEIEREKVESELRILKAQINPHFFFNTLNSVYSLSLDKSEKAPELILRLSELMRYILYETKEDYVPMESQLEFLKNYIYLQKMRNDENLDINVDIKGDHPEIKIAPLLFIPFIENAFKHVAKDRNKPSFIRIAFDLTSPDKMIFSATNSKFESSSQKLPIKEGIGLENVKKQLNLLYPSKHELKISDSGEVYTVELSLQAK
jgi:LytS/YehU family sensor histidine kinase